MMFGKARLVFAGRDTDIVQAAIAQIEEIPNAFLAAAFTKYEDAVLYARSVGCDAVVFDCASKEGMLLQRQIQNIDPDILICFLDKFYIAQFGWCEHEGQVADIFQNMANISWYDPYHLPKEYGCKAILDSIDKNTDPMALFNQLPEQVKQHSKRVADRTVAIMKYALEYSSLENSQYATDLHIGFINYLYEAALFHDVGKVFLPDWLLNKQEPLTRRERTLYHMHVQFGDYLAAPLDLPLMIDETLCGESLRRYMVQSCAAYHHEFIGSEPLQGGHDPADTPIWAQVCGIVNLADNLVYEGLDGRKYVQTEADGWIERHRGWFTPTALDIYRRYRQKADAEGVGLVSCADKDSAAALEHGEESGSRGAGSRGIGRTEGGERG